MHNLWLINALAIQIPLANITGAIGKPADNPYGWRFPRIHGLGGSNKPHSLLLQGGVRLGSCVGSRSMRSVGVSPN